MMGLLTNIFAGAWHVLLESAPFILFGFFAAGLIKALVPDDFVIRHLGARQGRGSLGPVIKAALLGVPLPLCSCGVIPAAAGIRSQGASKGATASFLISTPETGVDSMAVTYALLDPLMTVLRPVAAFVSAVVAGVAIDLADPERGHVPGAAQLQNLQDVQSCGCSCGCGPKGCAVPQPDLPNHHDHGPDDRQHAGGRPPLATRLRDGFAYGFGDMLPDIGGWFLLGVLIAGAVAALVPADFVAEYLSSGPLPMLAMLALSMPMYVCATASTPIAAALVIKGVSPGAALVFLLAGPATNAATILVVARMLGKRAAAIYASSVGGVALIMGFAVDAIYSGIGISAVQWARAGDGEVTGAYSLPLAIVLLALIVWPYLLRAMRALHRSEA